MSIQDTHFKHACKWHFASKWVFLGGILSPRLVCLFASSIKFCKIPSGQDVYKLSQLTVMLHVHFCGQACGLCYWHCLNVCVCVCVCVLLIFDHVLQLTPNNNVMSSIVLIPGCSKVWFDWCSVMATSLV